MISKIAQKLSILFFLFITTYSFSQKIKLNIPTKEKEKGLIKNAVDTKVNGRNGELTEAFNNYYANYDSTSFNYTIALNNNAGFLEDKDNYENQKLLLMRGAQQLQQGVELEANLQKAQDNNALGEIFFASGKYRSAEKSFNKSKGIHEKLNDTLSKNYARVINNLSLIYATTGKYNQAEIFIQRTSYLTNKRLKLTKEYAISLNNLAMLYKDLSKYNEAEELINKAIALIDVKNDPKIHAIFINNKAIIFQNVGRLDQAEDLLTEAINTLEKNVKNSDSYQNQLSLNLAFLYQDMERYEEAEKIYLKVIKKDSQKNHPEHAHKLNSLASLYMITEKYDKVETPLLKALGIYEKRFGKIHPAYATALNNLGNLYRVTDKLAKAQPILEEALQTRKTTLGEDHPQYIESQQDVATLYWQMGRNADAAKLFREVLAKNNSFINKYFAPMSENEKEKYWTKVKPTFEKFYSFAINAQASDASLLTEVYNYHINTKGILLNTSNKIKKEILKTTNKALVNDYLQWVDLKEYLAKLYSYSKEELKEEQINIDSLETVTNTLEKKLSANSGVFKEGYAGDKITYAKIAQSLLANEAAVEVIRFREFNKIFTSNIHYAFLIAKKENNVPQLVLITTGNQLEDEGYAYYKNTIKFQQEDTETYKKFWSGLETSLANKNQVYLSLDGVYNQVNVNTLQKAPSKFLIDEKNLIFLTNTKDVLTLKANKNAVKSSPTAVLVGYPYYGDLNKITSLPGTKVEVEAINQLLANAGYKTKLLLNKQATEDEIKNVKNPTVLHIATHGYFLDTKDYSQEGSRKVFGIESSKAFKNPLLRSGLILANAESMLFDKATQTTNNGVLTAYETTTLELNNTELVVLSACETGLGTVKSGEGVYGLQRAFKMAGANAIIMSLWQVDDKATQELMRLFYQNWLKTGNKTTAFKQAQLQLKQAYKHPYFWGAFILVD